jgi:tRNA(Ile)-lysidine synthase
MPERSRRPGGDPLHRPATGNASRLARPPAVAAVLQTVTSTARAHSMFQRGTLVVAAVSGGPDSMCLLHSLVRLRRLFGIRLACFHFDHGLREGSAADAAYVRAHARKLGVPLALRRAGSRPRRGESVEAWARQARYGALLEVLEEMGGRTAALGHTADDQAETVLLALVRGGGLEAVSGMRPAAPPFVRPLLNVTRQETEGFCRALRLRPRDDPMNRDPRFLRVALRAGAIPELERAVGRNVRTTLARSAALLAQDADLLAELAERHAQEAIRADGDDVLMDVAVLARLPTALASRVVRRALLQAGLPPESAHVQAVLSLESRRPGASVALPAGLRARRERGYVRLVRPSLGSSPVIPGPPAD